MASTSTSPAADAAERRSAHVRVGTAATAAFAALLLFLLVTHGSAEADRAVPSAAPMTTEQPQQAAPTDPGPGFRRGGRGGGGRRGGGPGFGGGGIPDGGVPDDGGAAPNPVTPAPDTGGNTT